MNNNNLPNNPNIEVIKAKETGLFTNYIFKAIPLAFDESMSYYETLCGLLNYLKNTILPTLNNNADAVSELQNLYIELKEYVDNYFTNLDVQEEINNKLDDLVNDGTLENIITPYFNNITESIINLNNNKRNKNELIKMQDLSQEVREALTGGSTAVIGQQVVTNASQQNYSISPNKLNFVNIQNDNLVDVNLMHNYYYDGSTIVENGNYICTDFIEIGEYTVNETTFRSNLTNGQYVLFDENKEYLKTINTTSTLVIDIENVVYVVMNVIKTAPYLNHLYLLKGNDKYFIKNTLKLPTFYDNDSILIPTDNLIGNSISPDNTNFIEHTTNNLFNKYFVTKDGGYFNNSGNYENSLSNYCSCIMNLPLYIKNETKFYQGIGTGFINLYDINFKWLGNISTPNASNFTIPYDNAVYIVKTLRVSEINNYYLIAGTNNLIDYYTLKDFVQIPTNNSKLKNKKIGFLGDSITYGLGTTTPYPSIIENNTECISYNYGISGNSIAKAGTNGQPNAQNNPMCSRYIDMDDNLDYVIVFGGTNDYEYQIPIGETNSNDIETFNGALNTLILGLIEKYPGKPLLFLTPLYRSLTHENGYKFLDYVNAIKERCSYYSIPYFNLTDRSTIKSLINTINDLYYYNGDRLHPNNDGQAIIARIIQNQIELI